MQEGIKNFGESEEQIGAGLFFSEMQDKNPENPLSDFTPEQIVEIERKKQILSSLAYFIGKDFFIPIEVGLPTPDCPTGWRQGKKADGTEFLQMNAHDLLEKPMDFLRFVTCHEGGHKRISRAEVVPIEEWKQPGFSFMMNAIEDPRDNNFVAESYSKFQDHMKLAYEQELGFEKSAEEKAGEKLGRTPRFLQAGFEYIKQWFRETQGKEFELSEDLPEDVRKAVQLTLESARDSWLRYPSRKEADESEETIKDYAKVSYEINRDEIWPEFKKLVEADIRDQKIQEAVKKMIESAMDNEEKDKQEENKPQAQQEVGDEQPPSEPQEAGNEQPQNEPQESNGENQTNQTSENGETSPGEFPEGNKILPQALKEKLTPEEQKILEEAIDEAIENAKGNKEIKEAGADDDKKPEAGEPEDQKPILIDLDSLPEELKQKIIEYIDSLPKEEQEELQGRAEIEIKGLEVSINEDLEGKLSDDPAKIAMRAEAGKNDKEGKGGSEEARGGEPVRTGSFPNEPLDVKGILQYKERLSREVHKDANIYEQYRNEVLPLIDKLETELRAIFNERKMSSWQGGYKTGKRIDVKKRLQEKAKDVPAMESKAWEKRELPKEKDYAITLLVDLSGSMRRNKKIQETFKAVIVLAEVLNRLGIAVEILGFNDEIYEYQTFGQDMSKQVREHMGGMFKEVDDSCCKNCGNEHNETDLGWAMGKASERLAKQKQENKMLIAVSDGILQESTKHPNTRYGLSGALKEADSNDITSIGLEVGKDGKIGDFFPHSITGIDVSALPPKLAELLKNVIANNGKF